MRCDQGADPRHGHATAWVDRAQQNALCIGCQAEIRDRTTKGQYHRIAGLNLLTAIIIIYWNPLHLGHAVAERRNEGIDGACRKFPHRNGWDTVGKIVTLFKRQEVQTPSSRI